MSHRSWVCFACRKGVRRDAWGPDAPSSVTCPDCGSACTNVGYKLRIPRRRDAKEWSLLEDSVRGARVQEAEARQRERVQRRHRLERAIADLRERPANRDREQLIQRLEDGLRDA